MAYKRNAKPEIIPGSNPEAHFYEQKDGGSTYFVIDDNRLPFAATAVQATNGIYDPMKKIARFNKDTASDGFNTVREIIQEIPYFEIQRNYAKYAAPKLKGEPDIQIMMRPIYDNNPDGPTSMAIMASSKEAWQKGQAIAHETSRATPEQIKKITEASDKGLLDERIVQEDAGQSVDDILNGLDAGAIDQPLANRIINSFTPVNERTIEAIGTYVKEGRLNDRNSPTQLDKESLRNLSQRDGYKLCDIGKSMATEKQRREVQALLDLQYTSSSISGNMDELKAADAREFVREKEPLVNQKPEHKAVLAAARSGEGFSSLPKAAAGPNAQQTSADYVAAFAAKQGSVETALPSQGFSAIAIGTATPYHLVAFLNAEKTQHAVMSSDAFTSEMQKALGGIGVADYGSKDPLAGQVFTINHGRRNGIEPSTQTNLAAAVSERMGLETSEKVKGGKGVVKAVGPNDMPDQGQGSVMNAITPGWVSIATNDNLLVTVEKAHVKGEPRFLSTVEFENPSNGAPAAAEVKANKRAPVGAGRGK